MEQKNDKKFKTRTINHTPDTMGVKPSTEETDKLRREKEQGRAQDRAVRNREGFASTADRIANSTVYNQRHPVPELREHYKGKSAIYSKEWTVERYYPFAVGGPLFVEIPRNEKAEAVAIEKVKLMRKLGLRAVAICPGVTFEEIMLEMVEKGIAA